MKNSRLRGCIRTDCVWGVALAKATPLSAVANANTDLLIGSSINRSVVANIETYISMVANSLFIDCVCAVRRLCPNMSLQQVHARKFNYMVQLTLWRRLVECSMCAMSS